VDQQLKNAVDAGYTAWARNLREHRKIWAAALATRETAADRNRRRYHARECLAQQAAWVQWNKWQRQGAA
jgi:hypothetical protein